MLYKFINMNKGDVQSIILNFNKNFANSKGYQFTQLVNQQLEIKPNSMVALYGGNLVRKPIVLSEDTIVTLNISSQFPSPQQLLQIQLNQDLEGPTSFQATISKGHYSKLTFCRELVNKINAQIEIFEGTDSEVDAIGTGNPMTMRFPYQMFYDMKDGQFFLGLRYTTKEQTSLTFNDNYPVSFLELNDDCNTSQAVTFVEDDKQVIFHRTAKANDWDSYALGNQPIKGMSYCFTEDGVDDKLGSDISFSTCQVQAVLPGAGTSDLEFLYALDNTYFQSKWADASPPAVETSNIVYADGNIDTPVCTIGAYFDLAMDTNGFTKQSLMIIANEELEHSGNAEYQNETNRDSYVENPKQILREIDLSNYEVDLTYLTPFRWEIYCENTAAKDNNSYILEEERVYYVRFLTSSPYQQSTATVLFDSKEIGYSINSDMVETGYLFQQIESYSDPNTSVTGGLCPQFYFKNSNENFVVYNPRQNSTVTLADDKQDFQFNLGINGYNYEIKDEGNVNTSALQNVLGVAENTSIQISSVTNNTNFNPNNYPKKPDLAGLTQLGSDRTRYNVELNLPIKAFNTTESNVNDLGQTRTIVYNTNPVIEDVTNVSSGLINASIDPNNLKFLSLNNERALKLNNLDVNIRRAKTNELAEEITDASIELLIQAEPTHSQIDVLL